MDVNALLLAAIGAAALLAAFHAWREREHRYDVALLAATGAGLGISAAFVAA